MKSVPSICLATVRLVQCSKSIIDTVPILSIFGLVHILAWQKA